LRLAAEVSGWSKDRSTKCGAVVVRRRRLLSTGYNGFPPGVDDGDDRLHERPAKYFATEHAERNAIYNAALHGVSCEGSTMFIYGLHPCSRCARAMAAVGIKEVVYAFDKTANPEGISPNMGKDDFEIAARILRDNGIFLVKVAVDGDVFTGLRGDAFPVS
jgi:dCMP deaminase